MPTLGTQPTGTLVDLPPSPAPLISNLLIMIDNESPGATTLSAKEGKRTERMSCAFDEALDTHMAMLGYTYTDGQGADAKLKRVVPLRHPLHTNYYCTQIDNDRGLQFAGKYDSPTGKGKAGVMQQGARYTYSVFDATFEPSRIYYAPDEAGLAEYERYISYEYEGRAEFLERPLGQMMFTEGPGLDSPYQGRIVTLEQKADFQVMWWQVPEDWISANSVGGKIAFPTKIFACIGTVNSEEIFGMPAGTLLMLKPKILRYPAPLLRSNPGTLPPQTFYCDVMFNFQWFDPPPGSGAQRGHNNKPWFAGEAGSDTNYYLTAARKADGTASSVYTFKESDHRTAFEHW